jgi:hypothetical protein
MSGVASSLWRERALRGLLGWRYGGAGSPGVLAVVAS